MMFLRLAFLALLATAALAQQPPRYLWVEDGDGRMHLLDSADEDAGSLPRWDGATSVTLNLYTQNNPSVAQVLKVNDDSSGSNFNSNNPTRFVIHGWISTPKTLDSIREAYINSGKNYNVIMVDWSETAADVYAISKSRTQDVGEYLATVAQYLQSSRGLNLDDLYIIGHSLGGHVAGVAGDRLGGKAASVIGMDPALPLFLTTPSVNKLDPSDAKFVQVIHTNGGVLGYLTSIGNADFFPNGGTTQTGCELDISGTCSHHRVYVYYAESISSTAFVARRCSSYYNYSFGLCNSSPSAVLGEQASHSASGDYYLRTNIWSPYAKG